MSDTNLGEVDKEASGDEKDEDKSAQEDNVVINVEKKKKPRKQLSPEAQANRLENLAKGRAAAHAKRRALESTVKISKIKKLQAEVDKSKKESFDTSKKEYKEADSKEEEIESVKVYKKKKKKVVIEESESSSEEEVVVRRKKKLVPPPPPPVQARCRPPPTEAEREAAAAARERALMIQQQQAKQDKLMNSIFG